MCGPLSHRDGSILKSRRDGSRGRRRALQYLRDIIFYKPESSPGFAGRGENIIRKKDKKMKKKFKPEDLDCANCAAKMEEAIKKIPGVNDANVSFMAQKMTIDAEDEKFDEIMKEVAAVCAKVEPDCRILL